MLFPNFNTFVYIHTLWGWLARQTTAVERVPGGPPPNGGLASARGHCSYVNNACNMILTILQTLLGIDFAVSPAHTPSKWSKGR